MPQTLAYVGINQDEVGFLANHMGRGNAQSAYDKSPGRRVFIDEFAIDTCPVSRKEFLDFFFRISHANYSELRRLDVAYWHRFSDVVVYDERAPIVSVTFEEAAIFAWFHGGRLPTDWEWQVAARGPDMELASEFQILECSRYPSYIDESEDYVEALVAAKTGLLVEPFHDALLWKSPYGIRSLIGNADEWVDGVYDIREHTPPYVTAEKPWQLWAERARLTKRVGAVEKYPHPGPIFIGNREQRFISGDTYEAHRDTSIGFRCAYNVD